MSKFAYFLTWKPNRATPECSLSDLQSTVCATASVIEAGNILHAAASGVDRVAAVSHVSKRAT